MKMEVVCEDESGMWKFEGNHVDSSWRDKWWRYNNKLIEDGWKMADLKWVENGLKIEIKLQI